MIASEVISPASIPEPGQATSKQMAEIFSATVTVASSYVPNDSGHRSIVT